MSSAFDDLLNLDGPAPESTAPATTNNSDPFDMFSSEPPATNESTGNNGGGSNLLDFGFDAQISTDNGSSGKVNFEASSNPLYDFTHTETKMESDSSNPLYELNNEPATQKEVKSEPSNLLYEYIQNEGQSNGHVEGGLTNGATENGVDLLGGSGDLLGDSGDVSGTGSDLLGDSWANVSQGQVDLLGEGDSQNVVVDDKTDLLGDSEPTEDKPADLLIEPEPVVAEEPVVIEEDRPVETQLESTEPEQSEPEPEQLQSESEQTEPEEQVQDTVVSEPGETTQTRSRSSSESSVPEQEKGKSVQSSGPISDNVEIANDIVRDQSSGPVDNEEPVATEVEAKRENFDEALDKGTIEVEPGVQEAEQPLESAPEPKDVDESDQGTIETKQEAEPDNIEVTNEVIDDDKDNVAGTDEVIQESGVSELVAETDDQFDDADVVAEPKEADAEGEVQNENVEEVQTEDVNGNEAVQEQEVQEVASDPVAESDCPSEVNSQPIDTAEQDSPPAEEPVKDEIKEEIAEVENATPTESTEVPESVQPADEPEPAAEKVEAEDVVEEATNVVEAEVAEQATEGIEQDNSVPAETTPEIATLQQAQSEVVEPAPVKEETVPEQVETESTPDVATEVPQATEPEIAEPTVEQIPEKEEAAPEPAETKAKESIKADPAPQTLDFGDEDTAQVVKETEQIVETRQSEPEENALKVNGASEVTENGISEEDAIHFAEMNNVRQKFESGKTSSEEQTPKKISVKDEYDQGGEFENEPVRNPDVVREADQPTEELPEIGMAKNLVSRFKSISENKDAPVPKPRARSPARAGEKVEYESQPAEHLPQYEAKVESGVFESEPRGHEEEVVRAGDTTEDYKPEQGYAKNILNRFKEIETESTKVKDVSQKREITPDRSGKVEYVSEPRSERIEYNDVKSESGVFENAPKSEEDVVKSGDKADEVLPEAGYAKSLLSKFKQMESEVGHKPPPSPKRAISQDKSAKSEFVSEPKGYLERYEPQTESGEYENKPAERGEVIRSGEAAEEILPEAGSAKKTMERFKEIQKQSSSPVSSSQRSKAMTPPREVSPGRTVSGVVENTPKARDDVVRSGEAASEPLPEQGSTRNILNKFKEIQTSGSQSSSPGKKPKEFTPPPESGVYENTPQEHLVVETRQSESGVLENTPSKSVADVAREREQTPEKELPEQGYAKNMVSKWKQLESSSGNSAKSTSSTSPRFKQFTPPRDSRGPMSPKSPVGVTNGVHPSELPGQYQPQESSVIVENNPEVMEGIYRESDTDWNAGMPAANTTASMLQKFKQIQSQAKESESSQAPVTRKS